MNLLVGLDTPDDAAVYRLTDEIALVQTVDFFTPLLDDAYAFGQVAAANALSDIYAMGGRPLFALNIVAFPAKTLPAEVLGDIIRGGAEKAAEAGVSIVGGHSIDDPEPKYGLAVTGIIHPDRVVTKSGARPGDALFLTKPLGTGILATAHKRGALSPERLARLTANMTALNRGAAEAMLRVGVDAATDVTGFGLLGHLGEMLEASGVGARLQLGKVPFLEGAREEALAGNVPGGTRNNLRARESSVRFAAEIAEVDRLLLADAQTSGGLLLAVPAERREAMAAALREERTLAAAEIGQILDGPPGVITVVA